MAIVLADGSASSLKALELAFIPGFLVAHEAQQLVILHGWKDTKDVAALAPVHTTIAHINQSRVAQATLNYKIEMVKVSGGSSGSAALTSEPSQLVLPPVSSTPTQQPPSSPTKDVKGKAVGKGKDEPKAAAAGAILTGDAETLSADAPTVAENVVVAQQIVEYTAERCAHHRCDTIVLGVGNSQVGKSLSIGSVCKELVARHRSAYNIFCMKASGPTVRPTAAMRMMALVIPGTSLAHLQYALSISSAKKGDRIGVMIVVNNGKAKPQDGVSHMSGEALDERGVMTVAEVTRRCTAMLAGFGLTEAPPSDPDAAPSAAASESFPIINHVALEPTNTNPTPTVEESGLQLVKIVGGLKVDFLVLPPKREGLSDAYLALCLSAPKPHVLLVKD